MAQRLNPFVYIVQQQDFEHHTDRDGRLSILGCYHRAEDARRFAKATANHIYRDTQRQYDGGSAMPPDEDADAPDERYCTEVYLFTDVERSLISVNKMYCSPSYGSGDYTTDEDDDDDEDEDDEIDWWFDEVGPGPGPGPESGSGSGRNSQGTAISMPSAASHSSSAPGPTTHPSSRPNIQPSTSNPQSTTNSLTSPTAPVSSHQPTNRSHSLTHPHTRPIPSSSSSSRAHASSIDRETWPSTVAGCRTQNQSYADTLNEATRNSTATRQEPTESPAFGLGRHTALRERSANAALRRNRADTEVEAADVDGESENRRALKRQRMRGSGTLTVYHQFI